MDTLRDTLYRQMSYVGEFASWDFELRSFLNQDFIVLQCMQTVVKRMLFTIKFMAVWVFDKFIGYLETFSQIKQSGVGVVEEVSLDILE